jgi:dihydropyrimidine dehydrogenase (NAD+) subunit PreT
MQPQTREISGDRFVELKAPLSPTQAVSESNRCLYCHDAPCARACPTHIDVPAFIKKIGTGNLRGSARTILEANILGASCARVCPTEVLCEGACVMHGTGQPAIEIGLLQRYATEWVMDTQYRLFEPVLRRGRSVGVIGGGPAGLGCAAELARLGYSVTIYEAHEQPGGLNAFGVAEYKMRVETAMREIEWVKQLGVEILTNTPVGPGGKVSFNELEKRHEAIFVGVGLGSVRDLEIPGELLGGVRDALSFIKELKTDRARAADGLGRRVVVIGGGNTAIDCVTQARRLGAEEVTLIYRRGPEDMPAYAHEIDHAMKDGVRFQFFAQPVRIVGRDRVEGVECTRMTQRPGRRWAPEHGSEFVIPAETVLKATGQAPRATFFKAIPGIVLDGGRPVHDPITMQTKNPRYFVGGDCANGGKEVVNAVAEGKRAARAMHRWLETGRAI